MNAPFHQSLTTRELRWLRHIAIHGPQSSEFLLALCADTHRCRDTGLRTLRKLRDLGYLRLPSQQWQIAKADFNPYVYDLTRRAELFLKGLGDPDTVRPTGHWWHSFLTSSITSTIAIAAERSGFRYIPAHHILNRANATLAVPFGKHKLIPDQLFAIDYGGTYRSFLLEVDRGTEPYASKSARKSLERMLRAYAELTVKDALRRHYGLKSPLVVLFAFVSPHRAARCLDSLASDFGPLATVSCVSVVPSGFARFADLQRVVDAPWERARHVPLSLLA